MSDLSVHTFASTGELDDALSQHVAAQLANAIRQRDRGVLVVSGGSTPRHFFRKLSNQEIPWSKVAISLADERWVDRGHPDSNEKMVRENLLINNASEATFVGLKTQASNPFKAEQELEDRLGNLGCIDVLMLGMGNDGHTASLFPDAENILAALNPATPKSFVAIQPQNAPYTRMTMTLRRLLDARDIIIHITGQEKRRVLEQALRVDRFELLPISAILQQTRIPVSLYWAEQ